MTNPRVLIEVLSPSTEEYDRGEKREHYQRIASLMEIVLVAQDRRSVDVWRRGEWGWARSEVTGDGVVDLSSLGCQLPVSEIYRDPLA